MNRSKELFKNTTIITIGKVSTQFVSFMLLPLYTALLTKSEYGTVDLISTIVQLMIPVVSLMIDQGVFRFLLNCETDLEKTKVVTNAILILVIANVICLVIYLAVMPFLHSQYKIWILLILIVTTFSNLFLQIARGLRKITDYALGSFICSTSIIVLNVLCIVFIKMGAEGMLIATFCGNLICCIFLFVKLKIFRYFSFAVYNKKTIYEELKYSMPLVPNQLSLWVMNGSDRLIVSIALGTAANGILAVSQKFPAIYMTFFNIFQLAWHETGAIHYFDKDRDQFFSEMLDNVITIFSTLCMAIIVILPLVFNWFVNFEYNAAYYNIPIYLIASLFSVIVGLLGVVYVATKKTSEIAKTTLMSAVLNVIFSLTLIDSLGLYAASLSTFIGYFITMIYRINDTRKYLKIKYNIKKYFIIFLCILLCTYFYYLNNKVLSIILLFIYIYIAIMLNKKLMNFMLVLLKKKRNSNA